MRHSMGMVLSKSEPSHALVTASIAYWWILPCAAITILTQNDSHAVRDKTFTSYDSSLTEVLNR